MPSDYGEEEDSDDDRVSSYSNSQKNKDSYSSLGASKQQVIPTLSNDGDLKTSSRDQ